MQLFPHLLVRVGGQPFEMLERLNLIETTRIVAEIHHCEKRTAVIKRRLSDGLYTIIQNSKDPRDRVGLLNLKRDIHNERGIAPEKLRLLTSHLPANLSQSLHEFLELREQISSLMLEGERLFPEELAQSRASLRDLAEDSRLQEGLLLSSQSLLTRINKSYLRKDPKIFSKSDHDTERSLIKYLSRMCAKTSPFSTFTNLASGTVVDINDSDGSPSEIISVHTFKRNKLPRVVGHIRLNNFLYQFLLGLLTKNKEIYRSLLLRPNPTITRSGDQYLFLTNSDNVESFQRLSYNPAIEICQKLTAAQEGRLTYEGLVRSIVAGQYFDATVAETEALLNQLIEFGFLEFNIGVSGIDPDWDLKLCENLKPLADRSPLIEQLLLTLGSVRELAGAYGRGGVETRAEILETAYRQFWSTCMKLHEAAGLPEDERKPPEEKRRLHLVKEKKDQDLAETDRALENTENTFTRLTNTDFNFKPEQMFYEDTTIGLDFGLSEGHISKLVSTLRGFVSEIGIFATDLEEKARMRYYFVEKYGHGASVALQTFYEDYYRDVKKPTAEKVDAFLKQHQKQTEQRPEAASEEPLLTRKEFEQTTREISQSILPVPAIKQILNQREAWLTRLVSLLESRRNAAAFDEVRLTLDIINEAGQASPGHYETSHASSFGAFIQLFEEAPKDQASLKGVVNLLTPGFGKMISRFLHIFRPSMTEDLRNWNKSMVQNSMLAEACDASFFNANLHPSLMTYELSIPNSNNRVPVARQIPVTELEVCLGEQEASLRLIHKPSQKQVLVFDLGLQNIFGRSQIYQLLSKFTLAHQPRGEPVLDAINEHYLQNRGQKQEDENQVRIRPRIILDNQVILQRKAWIVPKGRLPRRAKNETDWVYLTKINRWRKEYGMAEEIFMNIVSEKAWSYAGPESQDMVGRVDHKPQYISFNNPFLVRLFESLTIKAPGECKIEEMLPSSSQLLNLAERRRVTEFVVQWYG